MSPSAVEKSTNDRPKKKQGVRTPFVAAADAYIEKRIDEYLKIRAADDLKHWKKGFFAEYMKGEWVTFYDLYGSNLGDKYNTEEWKQVRGLFMHGRHRLSIVQKFVSKFKNARTAQNKKNDKATENRVLSPSFDDDTTVHITPRSAFMTENRDDIKSKANDAGIPYHREVKEQWDALPEEERDQWRMRA